VLSHEDNELLTRVGPATPMGNLLRCFWLPFAHASELPSVDGDPLRVRLLGEDLVAFRDTTGRVGLLAANCPHRGASLFSDATGKPASAACTTAGSSILPVPVSDSAVHCVAT